jgi:hypothetical protein
VFQLFAVRAVMKGTIEAKASGKKAILIDCSPPDSVSNTLTGFENEIAKLAIASNASSLLIPRMIFGWIPHVPKILDVGFNKICTSTHGPESRYTLSRDEEDLIICDADDYSSNLPDKKYQHRIIYFGATSFGTRLSIYRYHQSSLAIRLIGVLLVPRS